MNRPARTRIRSLLADEHGQVLPLIAVAVVLLLGMAGLTLDVGRTYYCNRELQEVCNAAALAGAGNIRTAGSSSAVIDKATSFSGTAGSSNASASVPNVTMASGFPVLKCLTTLQNEGIACTGAVPYNAIQVQEQSAVPMYFASLFGVKTITTTATATASTRGGAPSPYNVAVIIDSTLSMASPDSNCGNTEMQCALNGFQILLKSLSPCAVSLSSCDITNGVAANSVDRVSLFTFPDVSISTNSRDYSCTTALPPPSESNGYGKLTLNGGTVEYVMPPSSPWSTLPVAMSYSFPAAGSVTYSDSTAYNAANPETTGSATYQITPFLSDYRLSDKATTLNTNSDLVKAAGGVPDCGSMAPPNYDGVYGTYYAGAIYAAQAALTAEQQLFPGAGNVMIMLSDGDSNAPQANGPYTVMGSPATSNGVYPSWVGQCGQAVVAAQFATTQGTQVYSVAYGSEPTGCSTDVSAGSHPNISPCDTMAGLASAPQYFYSDYQQTGSGSTCVSSQPVVALSDIFSAIAADLTSPRLIPNSTT